MRCLIQRPQTRKGRWTETQEKNKNNKKRSQQVKDEPFPFLPSSPSLCFELRAETLWQQYGGGAEGKQDPLRQLTFSTDHMIPVFKLPVRKHRVSEAAWTGTRGTPASVSVFVDRDVLQPRQLCQQASCPQRRSLIGALSPYQSDPDLRPLEAGLRKGSRRRDVVAVFIHLSNFLHES